MSRGSAHITNPHRLGGAERRHANTPCAGLTKSRGQSRRLLNPPSTSWSCRTTALRTCTASYTRLPPTPEDARAAISLVEATAAGVANAGTLGVSSVLSDSATTGPTTGLHACSQSEGALRTSPSSTPAPSCAPAPLRAASVTWPGADRSARRLARAGMAHRLYGKQTL